MKFFHRIYHIFFFLYIFLGIKSILSQIKDNFIQGVLEDESNDLLDVTDYHNLNLIVSMSKNIYTGIPPEKKVTTDAQLISSTYLITINSKYLLAACLHDSLFGKIRLSDGTFTPLLDYTDTRISTTLEIPDTKCSLSNIDNSIFIGYSKKEYFPLTGETNKTNYVFKFDISNKEDEINGPLFGSSEEIISFKFDNSTILTPSSRQISCEPIRILDDENNEYRLVCMHEGFFKKTGRTWVYAVYAATINSNFNGFEYKWKDKQIESGDKFFSFRIFRENDTYIRCMTSKSLVEIYLKKNSNTNAINIETTTIPTSLKSFTGITDLFLYNNKFRFTIISEKKFMGKANIYSFQINNNYCSNYFKLYNYQETIFKNILGYYSKNENKIIFLYQTDSNIKYFIMDYMKDIFEFESIEKIYYLGSYEEVTCNLNDLITTSNLSDLGYLNVGTYKLEVTGEKKQFYGINFFDYWISDNILKPDPSLNTKETYTFSFLDNVENEYTRVYNLSSVVIKIKTCETGCNSCCMAIITVQIAAIQVTHY